MLKQINKILIFLLVLAAMLPAQNRGNELSYQGFGNIVDYSARALGMGGAYISMDGHVDVLHYNAAGLATIENIEINLGMTSLNRKWTENQVYNSNRYFNTLPFYLEELYIPDPANNGMYDYDVFFNSLGDSSYVVELPETGDEPYSDDAAEWIKEMDAAGISNLSIAVPFTVMEKNVVVGLAYNNKLDILDYDRNDTYLDPHPGYIEYNMPSIVEDESDSTFIYWSRYGRQRDGNIAEIKGAIGVDLTERLNVGLAMTYMTGETDESLYLNRHGWFKLMDQNAFQWSYDTLDYSEKSTSTFSGFKTEVGFQLKMNVISLGLNLTLPYTVKREWDLDWAMMDTTGSYSGSKSGTDEYKVPFSYGFGINFQPTDKFTFSFDYDLKKYADGEWDLADDDSTYYEWVDQHIMRFGVEYSFNEMVDVRGGYRKIPQVWVPDGYAYEDKGPDATAYTLGLGLNFGKFGSLDAAWEYRKLKYSDIYYSNTNYCKEVTTNILIGYTYRF